MDDRVAVENAVQFSYSVFNLINKVKVAKVWVWNKHTHSGQQQRSEKIHCIFLVLQTEPRKAFFTV